MVNATSKGFDERKLLATYSENNGIEIIAVRE
jgi:hypothetical protein